MSDVSMSNSHDSVVSADGTVIAFETRGSGPPVVLAGGAFNDRHSPIAGLPMAELLAPDFTAYAYDRRGRGDSRGSAPYAVRREIEDLEALVARIGEPVFIFGHSSGGALMLEAAIAGLPLRGVALYEPPYAMDEPAERDSAAIDAELRRLIAAGDNEEAVVRFVVNTGMPQAMVEQMRGAPFWKGMVAMAPTLPHETAVIRHDGSAYPPLERVRGLATPLLAMAGDNSPDWMQAVARAIAEAAPQGRYELFAGQDHRVPPEVVAPVLKDFFR